MSGNLAGTSYHSHCTLFARQGQPQCVEQVHGITLWETDSIIENDFMHKGQNPIQAAYVKRHRWTGRSRYKFQTHWKGDREASSSEGLQMGLSAPRRLLFFPKRGRPCLTVLSVLRCVSIRSSVHTFSSSVSVSVPYPREDSDWTVLVTCPL